MAITTSNSIRVNPLNFCDRLYLVRMAFVSRPGDPVARVSRNCYYIRFNRKYRFAAEGSVTDLVLLFTSKVGVVLTAVQLAGLSDAVLSRP